MVRWASFPSYFLKTRTIKRRTMPGFAVLVRGKRPLPAFLLDSISCCVRGVFGARRVVVWLGWLADWAGLETRLLRYPRLK